MKSLWDKYFILVEDKDVRAIDKEIYEFIKQKYQQLLDMGYSPREVGGYMHDTLGYVITSGVLRTGARARREERKDG